MMRRDGYSEYLPRSAEFAFDALPAPQIAAPEQCDRDDLLRRLTEALRLLTSANDRSEDALLHYRIGIAAASDGLYVDWFHVAERMAEALQGKDDDEAGA